jgi:hypothetical protein
MVWGLFGAHSEPAIEEVDDSEIAELERIQKETEKKLAQV